MCEALVAVFDKYGDKKNRNKARFKFVLDKLGMDKVKEHYEEEYSNLEGVSFPELNIPEESIPEIPQFTANNEFDSDPEFLNWKTRNSHAQKQEGFFNVQIKLLLGDQTSTQARAISKIASNYAGNVILITVNQNQMIPWVKEDAMGAVYAELKKIGLHKAGTEEIRDITCCPGSETCNLGITASRGLAAELSTQMENGFPLSQELDHLTIKASGCPNSCGQHHIASIGLHGGAKKVNGVLSPHYEIFLGGRVNDESATFGLPVIKIPAKNTPSAVRMLVEHYKDKKNGSETFEEFFDRNGKVYFRDLLAPFKDLPDIESAPQSYLDYGSDKKFSLEDRGQGECAGAVTDMIQDHLAEAERALFQGKLSLEKSTFAEAIDHAKRSLVSSARALLVTEGMDFDLDIECLKKFQSLVVDMEIVSPHYANLIDHYEDASAVTDEEKAKWWLEQCRGLVEECKAINEKLQTDKTLRIRTGSDEKAEIPTEVTSTQSITGQIDLLGVKCPFNYVKTKLKLETMQIGNTLEVLLDDGEPAENVPRSIQNDGHKVLSLVKENGHFKLIVEKV
jgi:sulfite reductase (ferredoxin)